MRLAIRSVQLVAAIAFLAALVGRLADTADDRRLLPVAYSLPDGSRVIENAPTPEQAHQARLDATRSRGFPVAEFGVLFVLCEIALSVRRAPTAAEAAA